MVSLVKPWVIGNVVAALTENQSDPAYVASHVVVPRDIIQAVLHVAGKALLLRG